MDTQETRIYLAVYIAMILVGAMLLYLFFQLYRQQKKNVELQREKSLIEISSLEQERSRIATDLHDDLGPLLSTIKFKVNSVEPLKEDDKKEIEAASEYLDEAIQRLRQISNGLLPTALARKGIVPAIEELIALYAETSKLQIGFDFSPGINLPPEKRIHIYRMAQEGIFNCIKHAGATRLLLTMHLKGSLLLFTITDNGRGIKTRETHENTDSRGLESLANRAFIMGGRLHIHTEPEKGTILEFEIPV